MTSFEKAERRRARDYSAHLRRGSERVARTRAFRDRFRSATQTTPTNPYAVIEHRLLQARGALYARTAPTTIITGVQNHIVWDIESTGSFVPGGYGLCTTNACATETWYAVDWGAWERDRAALFYNQYLNMWEPAEPRIVTPEEEAQRARAREARRACAREEQARREARRAFVETANARARELFVRSLLQEQREQWERERAFEVVSQTGRRYRIHDGVYGRHGNIVELDATGTLEVARICCAPRLVSEQGDIPHYDALLGQALALQFDEFEFRKAANFTPLVPEYRRAA